jgi:hypothetical protein
VSAKYNLVCEQGTTFNFQFQIKDDNTPRDLTSFTATMTVRPFIGATTTTVVATTSNGYITIDAVNGRITVNIPSSITAEFDDSRQAYDLVIDSGVTVTRILEGKFVVTPAVTV